MSVRNVLAGTAIALLAIACSPNSRTTTAESPNYALERLQRAYAAGDSYTVRVATANLALACQPTPGPCLERLLGHAGELGADGLEGLLVSLLEQLRFTPEYAGVRAQLGERLRFTAEPRPNLLMPVRMSGSPRLLVFDGRLLRDSVQAMRDDEKLGFTDALELLSDRGTNRDPCGENRGEAPPARFDAPVGDLPFNESAEEDEEEADPCSIPGSAVGARGSSLARGACFDHHFNAVLLANETDRGSKLQSLLLECLQNELSTRNPLAAGSSGVSVNEITIAKAADGKWEVSANDNRGPTPFGADVVVVETETFDDPDEALEKASELQDEHPEAEVIQSPDHIDATTNQDTDGDGKVELQHGSGSGTDERGAEITYALITSAESGSEGEVLYARVTHSFSNEDGSTTEITYEYTPDDGWTITEDLEESSGSTARMPGEGGSLMGACRDAWLLIGETNLGDQESRWDAIGGLVSRPREDGGLGVDAFGPSLFPCTAQRIDDPGALCGQLVMCPGPLGLNQDCGCDSSTGIHDSGRLLALSKAIGCWTARPTEEGGACEGIPRFDAGADEGFPGRTPGVAD